MVFAPRKVAHKLPKLLADINGPAAGVVSCARPATWLGMIEDAPRRHWIHRGTRVPRRQYADELLNVLDVLQAQRHDLEQAIDGYFNHPIAQCGRRTADELVIAGEADRLHGCQP